MQVAIGRALDRRQVIPDDRFGVTRRTRGKQYVDTILRVGDVRRELVVGGQKIAPSPVLSAQFKPYVLAVGG